MDSKGDSFIQNCENNPALYKECGIQWMEAWSERTMRKLPQMLLGRSSDESEKLGKETKEKAEERHVSGGSSS